MPSARRPQSPWQPHDPRVPISQGDLLLVGWGKTIHPDEARHTERRHPIAGQRDAFDLRFWDDNRPDILELWGRLNYGLAVVVTDGCAIDKEYNTLRDRYLHAGQSAQEAARRAVADAAPFVNVAEAWPVDFLPEHLQREAASGAAGYVPFALDWIAPEELRTYVVDLSRIATVSWRAIDRRLAMADARWVLRLQSGLCRYFAARTIRVSEDLADIFRQPVIQAEALTPPAGNPPRVRIRLHFGDGRTVDVEAIQTAPALAEPPELRRPGLEPRR